jgi:DNA repair ATPase RecN
MKAIEDMIEKIVCGENTLEELKQRCDELVELADKHNVDLANLYLTNNMKLSS